MKKLLFIILILFAGNATASSLPNCPDPSEIWHNCFGTVAFASGTKYVGEFKAGERHGQGTFTWYNGNKYVGEYKNDKRNGQGIFTWADGEKYVGEYKDGKRNGQGTYTYFNGEKYVGEYKDDKKYGQGAYTYASGFIEIGYYINDEFVPEICESKGLTKGSDPFESCYLELIKEINKDD